MNIDVKPIMAAGTDMLSNLGETAVKNLGNAAIARCGIEAVARGDMECLVMITFYGICFAFS